MILIIGKGSELKIEGYIDSDFMTDVDDGKSTSGCIFLCNNGAISWKNFKKPIIADLIIEVKYITISEAAKEVFWFKKFVTELGVMPSDAIALHCDNNDVIALAKEPRSN